MLTLTSAITLGLAFSGPARAQDFIEAPSTVIATQATVELMD